MNTLQKALRALQARLRRAEVRQRPPAPATPVPAATDGAGPRPARDWSETVNRGLQVVAGAGTLAGSAWLALAPHARAARLLVRAGTVASGLRLLQRGVEGAAGRWTARRRRAQREAP